MIADKMENASLYRAVLPGVARALEILQGAFVHQASGRYEIDGDEMFGIVQRYTTRPLEKCNLETHRKYIDVQYVTSGEEAMNFVN